jgi:hypothetical protein
MLTDGVRVTASVGVILSSTRWAWWCRARSWLTGDGVGDLIAHVNKYCTAIKFSEQKVRHESH